MGKEHAPDPDLLLALGWYAADTVLPLDVWERALSGLLAREKQAVVYHLLYGLSFERCGELMGVSRSRVDQLFRSAVARVRRRHPHLAEEFG